MTAAPETLGSLVLTTDSESPVDKPDFWAAQLESQDKYLGGFNFKGDIAQASVLMSEFGQGRNFIRDFFKGKVALEYPDIYIVRKSNADPRAFYHLGDFGGKMGTFVNKGHLEDASKQEIHQDDAIFTSEEYKFSSNIRTRFYLAGVEETHHAVFDALNPGHESPARYGMSKEEYHASEDEWQALHFKIKAAKERRIGKTVVDRLCELRDASAEIRTSQGLETDKVPYINRFSFLGRGYLFKRH